MRYDPVLILPQHILDDIFGYLRYHNLLSASMVSKQWYQSIGSSTCMKKLQIIYNCDSRAPLDIGCLLNSTRRYESIKIDYYRRKKAIMDIRKEVKMILKKFSDTIKYIETNIDIDSVCDLPNLRKVELIGYIYNYSFRPYSRGLLSKLQNIVELNIESLFINCVHSSYFTRALKTMKNLKLLSTSINIFDGTSYPFSLTSFGYFKTVRASESAEISRFLESQCESLNTLILHDAGEIFDDIMPTILSMPSLTSLSLWSRRNSTQTNERLPINKSIKSLKLYEVLGYTQLLEALKNLEIMTVCYFPKEFIANITAHPSLRKVMYYFKDTSYLFDSVPVDLPSHIQFINTGF